MKSIKSKLLISFCMAITLIIAVVVITVSWRLSKSIDIQSKTLNDQLIASTDKSLRGNHAILKTFFDNIQKNVKQNTEDLCKNQVVSRNIESQQIASLAKILQTSCQTSGMDFAIVYDPQGRLQASFPKTTDKSNLEKYFKSWDLVKKLRKRMENDGVDKTVQLSVLSKHTSDFIKALGLGSRDIYGKGGISQVAGGIILDDFDDPMGICLTGKLLNNYHDPLKQLYDATGCVSILYLDDLPIAYSGFNQKTKVDFSKTNFKLNSQAQKQIYNAEEPIIKTFELFGKNYFTIFSTLKSFTNEKIAILCVGIPEEKVLKAQQIMLSLSIHTKRSLQNWLLGIGIVSFILFIIMTFIIIRGIVQPINLVVGGLTEAAEQVSSASGQVSGASLALADGSSKQAASIEEISSSIEEISSMTQKNADNANEANTIVKSSLHDVEQAGKSMTELTLSMAEISAASEETYKIIKSIDEIAFQTNLLSLNAAVEAARAGSAGASFAVVADEVRNLSQRTAAAAKSTSELIAETVKKIETGSDIVNHTNQAFSQATASSAKVGILMEEISAASNDQSHGIEQLECAVTEINRVTQQNAANAEESAGASEAMNAQANQVNRFVQDLVTLVGGNANGKNTPLPTSRIIIRQGQENKKSSLNRSLA